MVARPVESDVARKIKLVLKRNVKQGDEVLYRCPRRMSDRLDLIVTLLLSLGLWGTVWLTVSALAAMWPW